MDFTWRPPFIWQIDQHPDNRPFFYHDSNVRLSFVRSAIYVCGASYLALSFSAFSLRVFLRAPFSISAATNHWFLCLMPFQLTFAYFLHWRFVQKIKESGEYQYINSRNLVLLSALFPITDKSFKDAMIAIETKEKGKETKKGVSLQVKDLFAANRASFGTSEMDFSSNSLTREEFEEVFNKIKPVF